MTAPDEAFLETLRAAFKVEAAEHLQAIEAGLVDIERTTAPDARRTFIATVFRAAHSLKGAARAVNVTEIESHCQSLEEQFARWKRGESVPSAPGLAAARQAVNAMLQTLDRFAVPDRARPAAAAAPAPVAASDTETVRIAVSSLDGRLLEAEEMLAAKLSADRAATDLGALADRFEAWHKEWAGVQRRVRAVRQAADQPTSTVAPADLKDVSEFIDWNHDFLRSLEDRLVLLCRAAEQDRLQIGKLVDDLLDNSKRLLLLPVATLSPLLTKVARDLCRDQGKDAEFSLRGEDVTIDKRILEELKDPIIHLLRNSIDHGVETPAHRGEAGKSPRATVTLAVSRVDGNQVEIAVSDDGAGIAVDQVRAAAEKRGLAVSDAVGPLTDSATLALAFEPDVSTSPIITRVSGRGLGLAIVREKTEKLGGRVSIESTRGAGTTVRMVLPVTLATFRGILVEASQRFFVVPTAQVERVERSSSDAIQSVEGRTTLAVNGRTVALVELADVLQLPPARRSTDTTEAWTTVLILGSGDQQVAFSVDAVVDEREVLVKRLTKPLSRVRNIAGATILASGAVAPILNVADLLKSARLAGSAGHRRARPAAAAALRKRILLVEDSITSRMLLKGILESAGYEVKTAVDGVEGFTALRAAHFDLVVSDVEMPRLNGFDLTARIRGDKAFAEMPVVLVTALESREDRERGVDVGASAYLVKSSLDQSNLLEAVRRLA